MGRQLLQGNRTWHCSTLQVAGRFLHFLAEIYVECGMAPVFNHLRRNGDDRSGGSRGDAGFPDTRLSADWSVYDLSGRAALLWRTFLGSVQYADPEEKG